MAQFNLAELGKFRGMQNDQKMVGEQQANIKMGEVNEIDTFCPAENI